MAAILDFEPALRLLAALQHAPRPSEPVPLLAAQGRVLAQAVYADRDQPPFDRSTRDGFALLTGDTERRIVGKLRAGEAWPHALDAGSALQIMTGAPVPAGADAVVMIEHTTRTGDDLKFHRTLAAGENIVRRGSEALAGALLLPAGRLIGPAEIALAANCGYTELTVFTRPSVAIVATGDELVELDEAPAPHQIRNSNSYALAALVTGAGGVPNRLAIAPDTLEAIHASVVEARRCDLLIFSGGVSMGDYDLVEQVLSEAGAEFYFTGVRMQPGRPVVFGSLPEREGLPQRFFFGLPGNPISTEVTFHAFAAPFLQAMAGTTPARPRWAQATLAEPVESKPNLTRLLPARLDGVTVTIVPWQGSGDLAANARANCYAEFLPGTDYQAGDVLRILLR